MNVLLIRAKIKDESVAEVEASARRMFAAIEQAQPKDVRYASSKLADGVTFVILLEVEDQSQNPLAAVPEFREFQDGIKNWLAEPPIVEPLTVVGSYNLF